MITSKASTMLKVFADTNIVFEHALMRSKYKDCVELFKMAEDKAIECFCSAACFYTFAYVLRKNQSNHDVRAKLNQYLSFISILPTDKKALDTGIISSFIDIEDAFQYYTALGKVDYFITLNKKDYEKHEAPQLPVLSPAEFLKAMK
jgi:hypothetical protein